MQAKGLQQLEGSPSYNPEAVSGPKKEHVEPTEGRNIEDSRATALEDQGLFLVRNSIQEWLMTCKEPHGIH